MARLSRLGQHGLGWHALAATGSLLDPERRSLYLRAMRAVGLAFAANQAKFTATSFAARPLPLPAVALYPVAASMALSRLYVGVHYPLDTLAGAALGDAIAKLTP